MHMCRVGPELYMYIVYDRKHGPFPAKNTIQTPYIRMYVCMYGLGQRYTCADLHMCALYMPAQVGMNLQLCVCLCMCMPVRVRVRACVRVRLCVCVCACHTFHTRISPMSAHTHIYHVCTHTFHTRISTMPCLHTYISHTHIYHVCTHTFHTRISTMSAHSCSEVTLEKGVTWSHSFMIPNKSSNLVCTKTEGL